MYIEFFVIFLSYLTILGAVDNIRSLRALRSKRSLIKPKLIDNVISSDKKTATKVVSSSTTSQISQKISTERAKSIKLSNIDDANFVVDTYPDVDDEEDNDSDNDYDSIENLMESLDENAMSYVPKKYKKGDKIMARITRFGHLGMSVETQPDRAQGLILRQEVDFLKQSSNGEFDPQIGDTVTGYILYTRDDGKLDVSLRPIGFERFQSASDAILTALKSSPTRTLDIGDKSSPDMIMARLPGMSKNMYKSGISALLREGAIEIKEFEMTLIPEKDRNPIESAPYSGKTPRGFKPSDVTTLFIANFPYTTTEEELAAYIEEEIGFGKLAKLKLSTDRISGRPAGYAYANFFTPDHTAEALNKCNGIDIEGRKLRVAPNAKSSSALKVDFKNKNPSKSNSYDQNEYKPANDYSTSKSDSNNKYDDNDNNESLDDFYGSSEEISTSMETSAINQRKKSKLDTQPDDSRGKWRSEQSPYGGRNGDKKTGSFKTLQTREGRENILNRYQSSKSAPSKFSKGEVPYSVFVGGLPYSVSVYIYICMCECVYLCGVGISGSI